jgi:hypothetical protein
MLRDSFQLEGKTMGRGRDPASSRLRRLGAIDGPEPAHAGGGAMRSLLR